VRRAAPAPRLLCLPIRNTPPRRGGDSPVSPFALLTDTQRPLRIGKQSKGAHAPARRP